MIDHADDYSTWYMHLDNDDPGTNNGRGGAAAAFAEGLEVGDYVAAGQVIGYVGNSGNAEGTHHHTHFELRLDNRPIDPYPYLVRRPGTVGTGVGHRRRRNALQLARVSASR